MPRLTEISFCLTKTTNAFLLSPPRSIEYCSSDVHPPLTIRPFEFPLRIFASPLATLFSETSSWLVKPHWKWAIPLLGWTLFCFLTRFFSFLQCFSGIPYSCGVVRIFLVSASPYSTYLFVEHHGPLSSAVQFPRTQFIRLFSYFSPSLFSCRGWPPFFVNSGLVCENFRKRSLFSLPTECRAIFRFFPQLSSEWQILSCCFPLSHSWSHLQKRSSHIVPFATSPDV